MGYNGGADIIVKPENICTPVGRCGLQPHRVLCKSNYGTYYKKEIQTLQNNPQKEAPTSKSENAKGVHQPPKQQPSGGDKGKKK